VTVGLWEACLRRGFPSRSTAPIQFGVHPPPQPTSTASKIQQRRRESVFIFEKAGLHQCHSTPRSTIDNAKPESPWRIPCRAGSPDPAKSSENRGGQATPPYNRRHRSTTQHFLHSAARQAAVGRCSAACRAPRPGRDSRRDDLATGKNSRPGSSAASASRFGCRNAGTNTAPLMTRKFA